MQILTEIIGNIHSPKWSERMKHGEVDVINLDQWTAQKSRFVAVSNHEREWHVALKRQSRLTDGDVLFYDELVGQMVVVRLNLNSVMAIDLSRLMNKKPEYIVRISVELGHALGNQHWPAVVKGAMVYVPLTVDRKVMQSVMETHRFEDVSYDFLLGTDVIPYMAPHEIRRLFGGAMHDNVHHH